MCKRVEGSVPRTFHPPPHIALTLVGPSSVRSGRRAVSELLARGATAAWHADAALVVSELVSNAITECGECRLSAWFLVDEAALRVEVIDRSSNLPITQSIDSTRVGGHGLRIVEALSTRWGTVPSERGKIVWFEIDG
jgi:hypothetical protein